MTKKLKKTKPDTTNSHNQVPTEEQLTNQIIVEDKNDGESYENEREKQLKARKKIEKDFAKPLRFNPFQPNKPVFRGMFVGRNDEIIGIEKMLFQTKNGNPTNIMIVGELGMGKSSLLLVAKSLASGTVPIVADNDFMTVRISIDEQTTLANLAIKIQEGIEKEFSKENKGIAFIKNTWKFVQNLDISVAGNSASIKKDSQQLDTSKLLDNIISSISSTINALTSDNSLNEIGLTKKKDGLVLLIDEADKASEDLRIGSFLKNLTEFLVTESTTNFLLILAGLPKMRDSLRDSHQSSLRLFEEYELSPLEKNEVIEVINRGIKESNEKTPDQPKISVEKEAYDLIYKYSEGYPHFVQQIGSSMLEVNKDNIITVEDVDNGFFSEGGALDLIGNRFYRYSYEHCSKGQRKILKIIAHKWNKWIKIDEIKMEYKGNISTLRSSLKILKEKGVILKNTNSRGEYRLQWESFAFWITFQNN